jgi:hypothetical protein
MTINYFDQAARFAAKLDPPSFLRWLLRDPQPTWSFREWLDTRTLPFPGTRDRICDTVASLGEQANPESMAAVVVEFQTELDADILDRLLDYVGRLRHELRYGPGRKDKYRVTAALVNLTGSAQDDLLLMQAPGKAGGEVRLKCIVRTMADEEAAAVLAEIAKSETARCLLLWVPLMRGSGQPDMINQWKQLAEQEASSQARATYAGLALVFAELTRSLAEWRRELKEWNMRESEVVAGWQAEARAEGETEGEARGEAKGEAKGEVKASRAKLVRVLQHRFPSNLPADLTATIAAQTDPRILDRWFEAALDAATLEDFRKQMEQAKPS